MSASKVVTEGKDVTTSYSFNHRESCEGRDASRYMRWWPTGCYATMEQSCAILGVLQGQG